MIKTLTITNNLDESLTLDLFRPELSGFVIKSIDGLGPADASINMSDLATVDGSRYSSGRIEKRNLVLKLMFYEANNDMESVETLRQKAYKYFPTNKQVKLSIETDNRSAELTGWVESNEPTDMFTENSKRKEGCQISILSGDPFWYQTGHQNTTFFGVDPLFEFPFSAGPVDDVEDDWDDPIIMGDIKQITEGTVFYDGEYEIGMTMTIHAIGDASGLKIYDLSTREMVVIDDDRLIALTGEGIHAGDTITIETRKGYKGCTLLRAGEVTNILNVLDKPITWFELHKGDNLFAYRADEGLINLQFKITNRVIFKGV